MIILSFRPDGYAVFHVNSDEAKEFYYEDNLVAAGNKLKSVVKIVGEYTETGNTYWPINNVFEHSEFEIQMNLLFIFSHLKTYSKEESIGIVFNNISAEEEHVLRNMFFKMGFRTVGSISLASFEKFLIEDGCLVDAIFRRNRDEIKGQSSENR